MKLFICFLVLTLIGSDLYSGSFDSDVKNARNIESKGVVKCNPTGKNDGLTPLIAFKQLEPRMTLQLTRRVEELEPGDSFPPLIIPNDKIIITSREGDRINYNVVVKGKDCIIRNFYISSALIINNDAIIIDSIVNYVSVENESKRVDVKFYNTALRSLRSGSGKIDAELKNCTVKGSFRCRTNLKLTISESILFSEKINFFFYDYNNKKGRIALKNSLLHGNSGYGEMSYSPSSKKNGVVCLEPKDLRKLWSVTYQGENIYEAPKFQGRSYILAEDSPGKGKGIILEEHPVLKILNKPNEDKKKREEKRNAEKEKRRKELEEREKRDNDNDENDDDGLGGLPKPPE